MISVLFAKSGKPNTPPLSDLRAPRPEPSSRAALASAARSRRARHAAPTHGARVLLSLSHRPGRHGALALSPRPPHFIFLFSPFAPNRAPEPPPPPPTRSPPSRPLRQVPDAPNRVSVRPTPRGALTLHQFGEAVAEKPRARFLLRHGRRRHFLAVFFSGDSPADSCLGEHLLASLYPLRPLTWTLPHPRSPPSTTTPRRRRLASPARSGRPPPSPT